MKKEKFDLENFPTSFSAKKMLSYVTDGFYDRSYIGKWLYQVMGLEYDMALEIAETLPYQFFPETATWGLMWHERKWNLPVRENLSYEERRRLIYLKRDYRSPMTPYRMEQYLEDATEFKVEIADVNDLGKYGFVAPHPNVFKVYFTGEGTLDSKYVHEILNKLKQSHTAYVINERIEIEFDNKNIEQIILKNVQFKIQELFWYKYVYAGNVLLEVQFCYGLVLKLKYRQGRFYTKELIKLSFISFITKIKNSQLLSIKIIHKFGINFWNILCFDGSWNLEGLELLDAKRRYGLSLNIQNVYRMFNEIKYINQIKIIYILKCYLRRNIVTKVNYCFTANFWKIRNHNREFLSVTTNFMDFCRYDIRLSLTTNLKIDMSEQEILTGVTIKTKTKDCWFLDGVFRLDGSKKFNSIYMKEVLE